MFMRYEWGLAVGHAYAHADAVAANEEVLSRRRDREQVLSTRRSTIPANDVTSLGSAGEQMPHAPAIDGAEPPIVSSSGETGPRGQGGAGETLPIDGEGDDDAEEEARSNASWNADEECPDYWDDDRSCWSGLSDEEEREMNMFPDE